MTLLADLVVVLHLAFILFAALGGLLALRWRSVRWAHVPAAAWGVFIEVSGGICPLTPVETSLRAAAGQEAYAGDFVEHYVMPVIYPTGLTSNIQLVLGILLLALNVGVYTLVWRRRRG